MYSLSCHRYNIIWVWNTKIASLELRQWWFLSGFWCSLQESPYWPYFSATSWTEFFSCCWITQQGTDSRPTDVRDCQNLYSLSVEEDLSHSKTSVISTLYIVQGRSFAAATSLLNWVCVFIYSSTGPMRMISTASQMDFVIQNRTTSVWQIPSIPWNTPCSLCNTAIQHKVIFQLHPWGSQACYREDHQLWGKIMSLKEYGKKAPHGPRR